MRNGTRFTIVAADDQMEMETPFVVYTDANKNVICQGPSHGILFSSPASISRPDGSDTPTLRGPTSVRAQSLV